MTALRRLKDDAADAEDRREYDRAAALHDRIAQLENDPYWLLRAGEALRRGGHRGAAIERVTRAARAFHERGFHDKAVAACRWVLSVHPGDPDAASLLRRITGGDRGPPILPARPASPCDLDEPRWLG